MRVKRIDTMKFGNLWCAITEFENGSTEKRYFCSEAHLEWYCENMIGGNK